jgi:hypothetical protein
VPSFIPSEIQNVIKNDDNLAAEVIKSFIPYQAVTLNDYESNSGSSSSVDGDAQ